MKIAIKDIVVKNRVRKKLSGIKELANNIRVYGLINPISIYTGTKELKAGIRRVLAVKLLGWDEIDFGYVDRDVEASENLFREELTPEEKVIAVEKLAIEVKKIAREISNANLKQGEKFPELENLPSREKPTQITRDIVAKEINWSGKTYEKAKKFMDQIDINKIERDEHGFIFEEKKAK